MRITAVSGSTVTATFAHTHSASDVWGMVAIAPAFSTFQHHGFENINVSCNYGAGFWGGAHRFLLAEEHGIQRGALHGLDPGGDV